MNKEMKRFIEALVIRAIRTFFQTFIATVGSSAVILSDVEWTMVFSASLLSLLLSVATSIVTGLPEVDQKEEIDKLQREYLRK